MMLVYMDFIRINAAALAVLPILCKRWLPDGKRLGREWVARNPRRDDHNPGSFRINLATGKWADFAIDVRGGDVVSFAAYLFNLTQGEAARKLADMLEVNDD